MKTKFFMKNLIKATMVIALVAFMASCAGGPSTPGGGSPSPIDYSTYPTLGDALRSVGGLQVTGSSPNFQVMVRGGAVNSMNLNTLPLFVVDNVPIGTNYADAASVVNPSEIASIRVLNGTRAVTRWGNEGNAGVIEIKTNRVK